MPTLLLLTIFTPTLGALLVWAFARNDHAAVRQSALVTAITTLGMIAVLLGDFAATDQPYATLSYPWLGDSSGIDIRFSIGLDGLSLWLFGLSALLLLTSVLVSWEAIIDRPATFYSLLLLLGSGMLGVFAARDIILFYIFFEFTLIPLFFLIGVWGSEDRRYAAAKFFLYTLAGSVLTFLGLLAIVLWDYNHNESEIMTFSIPALTAGLAQHPIASPYQLWIFLALFAGFAIKVPLFPLHTWLPLAHVQAPTAGSVILAGILLKIGTYGFARFSIPMLPEATATCVPWLLGLSVAGIIYGALVALAQSDMKRLIAYSSVSHLGYCMLGLFALTSLSVEGSVLQMINHGLSTGGLFAAVGMVYERYHTREIRQLGGLARRTPRLAFFFVLFALSSIALPGLNGFAGEFLILSGMFQRAWTAAPQALVLAYQVMTVLAVFGVALGAWYMLYLVQRVFFGPLKEADHSHSDPPIRDLSFHEVAALSPLVVFIVWIGIQPEFFLGRMRATLGPVADNAVEALDERQGRHERALVGPPSWSDTSGAAGLPSSANRIGGQATRGTRHFSPVDSLVSPPQLPLGELTRVE
ncbi:MAG: NADH-quinone oxidoreductase subunit M [Planctomycetia bacterium]|nr:NADH-quinone oxidoreductase subunit M [Planctomycetia bacterium]